MFGRLLEGSGFRAASVRMIVSALARASRSSFPHRLFANVELATAWQAEFFGEAAQSSRLAAQLSDAVQKARQPGTQT